MNLDQNSICAAEGKAMRFYQLGNELRPELLADFLNEGFRFYQLGNSLHRFTSFESEWRTSQHQKTVRTP